MTPSRIRRTAGVTSARDSLTLTLAYRPPLAWKPMLQFLAGRATLGVESVLDAQYLRTVRIGETRGWVKVEPSMQAQRPGRRDLDLARGGLAHAAAPAAVPLRPRRPARRDRRSSEHDPRLARVASRLPGLRVPGAVDGFEMAVRAILGQRISVPGATTLAGRLAAQLR